MEQFAGRRLYRNSRGLRFRHLCRKIADRPLACAGDPQSRTGGEASLLEGGGVANGAFLRAGLVDELHLIVCPAVDGAKGAPSVFDSTEADADKRAPVSVMTL